jgi:hypothetical protein
MANCAGHTFIVEMSERRLLAWAVIAEHAGKQRDRSVTTLTVSRELDTSRTQQNVDALAIKRLARSVAMQRFGPCCVRILMTANTSFRGEELLDRNYFSVFSFCV